MKNGIAPSLLLVPLLETEEMPWCGWASSARLALWTVLAVTAAHPATIDVPFGKVSKLASPDGQYILYGQPYRENVNTGPELWIENVRTSERKLLLQLGGTARAAWSSDGTAFYVNDHFASDKAFSYIYETSTLKRMEIRDIIFGADPEAARIAKGHVYFDVDQWDGSKQVLVHLHGHTDEAPVRCFDFRYRLSRAGKLVKHSQSFSRATARGCEQSTDRQLGR